MDKPKILVVASHPDDECLGCGGTLLTMPEAEVHIMFLTDGVSSRGDGLPDRWNMARSVSDKTGWRLHWNRQIEGLDNKLDALPLLDVVHLVEYQVERFKPSLIFTHYEHDLNVDHRVAFQAVMTACRPFKYPCVRQILSFEVPSSTELARVPFQPDTFVSLGLDILDNNLLEQKKRLFRMYGECNDSRDDDVLEALARYRGTQAGCDYAEAFKTVWRCGVDVAT